MASQFYFPKWKNPYTFSYPEDFLAMEKFTGQNRILSGIAMQLLINCCQETDRKSKQRGNRKHAEITPVLLIVGKKILQNFARYLEFFTEFQNFLSIPRFLAEHQTLFCGKLMFRRALDRTHSFRHCIYLRFRQLLLMMPTITFKFRAKEIG